MNHKLLVCIDSDGCAFDSMEAKHRNCFGPQMFSVWSFGGREKEALEAWNEVNLYSSTRAVNRFKGLALTLQKMGIDDWEPIAEWTKRETALSNATLEKETHPALKRALKWSLAVNEAIGKMPVSLPFPNAGETIKEMADEADIIVVSSTNPEALKAEWGNAGLLPYVSEILSHKDGSKKECIARKLQEGYSKDQVIMIGDAPGDYQAAMETGVHFFPVIPCKEAESWLEVKRDIFPLFKNGEYKETVEKIKTDAFFDFFSQFGK